MAKKKMKVRRGAGAVVFRMKKGEPEFLLLHRVKRWTGWELLKGGRMGREPPISTLRRELAEEIKADKSKIASIVEIPVKLKFKTPPEYVKKHKYTHMEFQTYVVEYNGKVSVNGNEVEEHDAYRWASFRNSIRLLTYDSTKEQLKLAYSFIKKGRFN